MIGGATIAEESEFAFNVNALTCKVVMCSSSLPLARGAAAPNAISGCYLEGASARRL